MGYGQSDSGLVSFRSRRCVHHTQVERERKTESDREREREEKKTLNTCEEAFDTRRRAAPFLNIMQP